MSSYNMGGAPHLAAREARWRGMQSQQGARAFSPLAAPAMTYDQAMLNHGRSLPMAGENRALHPTGGIDSSPGHPGLYGQGAAANQQYLRETTPGLSQQGPQFQRWANDPGRIAQDKAAHGLWSEDQLAQHTANAQRELQGRAGNALAFGGPRPAASPSAGQAGQGLLAGIRVPTVAPIQAPPPRTIPADAMPGGPAGGPDRRRMMRDLGAGLGGGGAGGAFGNLFALKMLEASMPEPEPELAPLMEALAGPPSPGTGAAARNAVPYNSAGLAPSRPLDPSIRMPDASPVPGIAAMRPPRPADRYAADEQARAAGFRAIGDHGRADNILRDLARSRPEVAPVAPPLPGTKEHYFAAQQKFRAAQAMYGRNRNWATAGAADRAEDEYHMAYQAFLQAPKNQAEVDAMRAETEGRRLTNQGIPGMNSAQADRARAEAEHLRSQTRGIDDAGDLGQEGRDLSQAFQAGLMPYDDYTRRKNELRAKKAALATTPAPAGNGHIPSMASVPPTAGPTAGPTGGGAGPTLLAARARLEQAMPDLHDLLGSDETGPYAAYQGWKRAMERGYGGQGLGDPNSQLSRDFRLHLQNRLGSEAWRNSLLPSLNQNMWDYLMGSSGEMTPDQYGFQRWADPEWFNRLPR